VARPASDTRQRIQDVARELFAAKGVQRTSLQDIADRLGLTKPALYYHFASREELVRSIVAPLIEEGEAFLAAAQRKDVVDPRALLEGYFDLHYRHRADLLIIVAELPTLVELGLRRSTGLLRAVSRRVPACAQGGRRRGCARRIGSAEPGLGSMACASDSSSRKVGDSIWSTFPPHATGR
jgi:AcrR family transcriptional regulator